MNFVVKNLTNGVTEQVNVSETTIRNLAERIVAGGDYSHDGPYWTGEHIKEQISSFLSKLSHQSGDQGQ